MMNSQANVNDTVRPSLSDYIGKFLNTDGYAHNEVPILLRERFGLSCKAIVDTGRNFWYYIDGADIMVSSNGYVAKVEPVRRYKLPR